MREVDRSKIIANINNSALIRHLRQLEMTTSVHLYNFRQPNLSNAYSSMKANLNVDNRPVYTEWAQEIKWNAYHDDLKTWYKSVLKPSLVDEYLDYQKNTVPHHLSYFDPILWFEELQGMGINEGAWRDELYQRWLNRLDFYLDQFDWTDETVMDIPKETTTVFDNDKDNWNELLLASPLFGAIRHDATSGYPYYKGQSVPFVLRHWYDDLHDKTDGIITSYHRRHGAKMKLVDNVLKLVKKMRWIAGTQMKNKLKLMTLTHSFKTSAPDFSMYYRDWQTLILLILRDLVKYQRGYTTDQTKHDGHHTERQIVPVVDRLISKAKEPEHKQNLREVVNADYNNPTILLTPIHYVKLNRWISASGSPPTPLIETITNGVNHDIIAEELNTHIIKRWIQIDDILIFTEDAVDMEIFAKTMRKEIGFEMNFSKVEDYSETGIITLLQIHLGELYKDPPAMAFDVKPIDGLYSLSHALRKAHRLQFKERLRAYGDLFFGYKKTESAVPVDIQRFIGTLSSFGPHMPEDLWRIHETHFSKSKVWHRAIEYAKSDYLVGVNEFGFGPQLVLKRLQEY